MGKKREPVINPNSVNMIVKSTEFNGDLITENDIKFDGKLEGKLVTKSKLVLGNEGLIKGEVHCKSAVISGEIEGKIFIDDLITLQSSAKINGEIKTNKIAIEPGATFNGSCLMDEMPKKPKNFEKKETKGS